MSAESLWRERIDTMAKPSIRRKAEVDRLLRDNDLPGAFAATGLKHAPIIFEIIQEDPALNIADIWRALKGRGVNLTYTRVQTIMARLEVLDLPRQIVTKDPNLTWVNSTPRLFL